MKAASLVLCRILQLVEAAQMVTRQRMQSLCQLQASFIQLQACWQSSCRT